MRDILEAARRGTVPTRLSTEPGDPGFEAWRQIDDPGKIRILLDGVEQKFAIMADTKEGLVKRIKTHPDGSVYRSGDSLVEDWARGKVVIEVLP